MKLQTPERSFAPSRNGSFDRLVVVGVQTTLLLVLCQGAQTIALGGLPSLATGLVAVSIYLVLTAHALKKRDRRWGEAILLLLPLMWASLAWAGGLGSSEAVSSLAFYTAIGLLAGWLYRTSRPAFERVLLVAIVFHVVLAALETLRQQSIFYGSWKQSDAQTIGGILRVSSTPADPNYLALTLVILVMLAYPAIRRMTSSLRVGLLLAVSAVLLLTFSRSLVLGIVVGLMYLMFTTNRRSAVKITVAAGLSLTVLVMIAPNLGQVLLERAGSLTGHSGSDASFSQRSFIQSAAFGLFGDRPIFGHGIGASSDLLYRFGASLVPPDAVGNLAFLPQSAVLNTYLLIGVELGVVGLVVFAIPGLIAWRRAKSDPIDRAVLVCVGVILFTLDAINFAPTWALLGALLARRSRPAGPQGEETVRAVRQPGRSSR
jgi:O-antigen ligase